MSNIITFPISKSMALRHFNNRLNAEMAKIHANVAEIAVEFGSVEVNGEKITALIQSPTHPKTT